MCPKQIFPHEKIKTKISKKTGTFGREHLRYCEYSTKTARHFPPNLNVQTDSVHAKVFIFMYCFRAFSILILYKLESQISRCIILLKACLYRARPRPRPRTRPLRLSVRLSARKFARTTVHIERGNSGCDSRNVCCHAPSHLLIC